MILEEKNFKGAKSEFLKELNYLYLKTPKNTFENLSKLSADKSTHIVIAYFWAIQHFLKKGITIPGLNEAFENKKKFYEITQIKEIDAKV